MFHNKVFDENKLKHKNYMVSFASLLRLGFETSVDFAAWLLIKIKTFCQNVIWSWK